MAEVSVVLCLLCAIACTPADSSGGAPSQPADNPRTITARPTTLNVELPLATRAALARRLADGSLSVARLVLRDVSPRGAQQLKGVHLFVDRDDADGRTRTDDPHYAGSFVLGFVSPETIQMNIAPALVRLSRSGKLPAQSIERGTLRVTFVAEPVDPATRLGPDFALVLQALVLDVPE